MSNADCFTFAIDIDINAKDAKDAKDAKEIEASLVSLAFSIDKSLKID